MVLNSDFVLLHEAVSLDRRLESTCCHFPPAEGGLSTTSSRPAKGCS